MVSRLRASRFHYSWVVAAVTFLTLLGASGFRSTPGVLIAPLTAEFGWNRAVISLAVSINLILFGLSGPFAAALIERFGLRRVIPSRCLRRRRVRAHHPHARPWQLDLLWGVVVGRGHRDDGVGLRRDGRQSLVRQAARPGGRPVIGRARPANCSFCRCWPRWSRISAGGRPPGDCDAAR